MYTLVEPCAGSAAYTMHKLGARKAILPYQGSKWRHRHEIDNIVKALGFVGPPNRVILTDPGPWGTALGVILDGAYRATLIGTLNHLNEEDPIGCFTRLHRNKAPVDKVMFAAEFLYLQRLSFSGKAVGVEHGEWRSPGLNLTSAYGIDATERFGKVGPMIPSLIRTLKSYTSTLVPTPALVEQKTAARPQDYTAEELGGRVLVYIDPPYGGTTKYPNGHLVRQDVLDLAHEWKAVGASVLVSEAEGLDLPGWQRTRLNVRREDTSNFRGQQQEWVTYWTSTVM